ncbi:MAG: hypothetical protein OEQ18_04810 [Gammaproteobacteria bacterium]|nr:hypothetical protein [Gammaproteobacteria bacterium]
MTWIQKRQSSRSPAARHDALSASEAAPPPALPPAIQRMLVELPQKANWRPDEFMEYFNIGATTYKELVSDGRLAVVQFSPRIRMIQRSAICDYIRTYVKPV